MILHAVATPGRKADLPCLVWLHGFLGNEQEWAVFHEAFADWPQLRVDLPGHGGSADIAVDGFPGVDKALRKTLLSYNILKYWLVGYSLGGRVAMYHACQDENARLYGLIVEGGHPGLGEPQAKKNRRASDRRWAQRFRAEPLKDVLTDWYQQPVFSSLNEKQRKDLITRRSQNNPATLAMMLEATSPGVQPNLHTGLRQLRIPFHYICGERDEKFRSVAESLNLSPHLIPAAGHNAHRENPAAFRSCLLTLLRQPVEDTP
ncbi:2-succinyl-6-hydroxy-2,4-cyclohexadiene-1-carboxylate synthase [Enterobacteriaceae bacterium H18W14]|uniref:2-succinyl-6-hydroxy-2, 4-cyclohexadiene-1-carboxylate synthase n=1 Tax=Dryocola boscaweniae TaxID=2925397 RepID=UPI0022F0D6D4|nr:2-succinyl-6-hydroxy-2,4-cyclohexadiene-1-carboxylate synthase [Dryocola boscaweniae]MCT4716527.1 2-succinyl-6-hydroxy-2,4-cyclohexadiene-1-carboxylate synthase [Dryocola boscaweniae]